MKLTPSQLRQFDEEGYLFFPDYFSPTETAILKTEIPGVFAQRREENVREKTGDVVRTAFAVHTYNAVFEALVHHPRFVDPAGLSPGNVASPQDLGKLVAAASTYPLIREYSTTPSLDVTLPANGRKLSFVNTNQMVRSSDWKIGLSKTGYISEAGKCLVMLAMVANQQVVIVLMDSWGRLTRVGDANRIRRWLERNPGKLAATSMP